MFKKQLTAPNSKGTFRSLIRTEDQLLKNATPNADARTANNIKESDTNENTMEEDSDESDSCVSLNASLYT